MTNNQERGELERAECLQDFGEKHCEGEYQSFLLELEDTWTDILPYAEANLSQCWEDWRYTEAECYACFEQDLARQMYTCDWT